MMQSQAHKELHEKIWNCPCLPVSRETKYCNKCHKAVTDFMDKHGAGELTNDLLIEQLESKINLLEEQFEKEHIGREKAQAKVVELKEKNDVLERKTEGGEE